MRRVFSLFFILILLMTCTAVSAEAEGDGMTFETLSCYRAASAPKHLPSTYEATVKFPKNASYEYDNVIFGSYMTSGTSGLLFGVTDDGHPFLSLSNEDDGSKKATFKNIDVFTGKWVHIALLWDSVANAVSCYIDGKYVDLLLVDYPEDIALHYELGLGGDHRSLNRYYFKGSMKNAALYDDLRTEDEVASDYAGRFDQEGLMCYYDLSENGSSDIIKDQSGNNYDMHLEHFWMESKEPVTDYAYSFAVLGDPQWLNSDHADKLVNMFDWIAENTESKKIRRLLTLGDLTNHSSGVEWAILRACLDDLEGTLPYSLVRGNHDRIADYNNYFSYERYGHLVDGSFDETLLNTYKCFEVGKVRYLNLVLDFHITDKELEWANEVVAAHPDRNVIVSTHSYLTSNGELSTSMEEGRTNSGQDIWDKLVRKHENIVLVLCGHVTSGDRIALTQMEGDNGNIVTQMMTNPQSADHHLDGVGIVTMLYFSKDGSQVQVEYYSTDRDAYFIRENQFSFELDLVDSGNDPLLWIFIGAGALFIVGGGLFFLLRKKKASAQPTETE